MRIVIRKLGDESIISLPKTVLKKLGLDEGAAIDLSLENNKIILMPVLEEVTLEELLAGSPKKNLRLTEEDQEWLSGKPQVRGCDRKST